MTQHSPPPDPQFPSSRGRAALALRFFHWLLPSIVLGFAVPGFLILQISPSLADGSYVLTANAMTALQDAGWSTLVLSAIVRAVMWPPPMLQAVVRRYS